MKIGFIGIGVMGSQIVRNLINKGHSLTCLDVRPEVLEKIAAIGAKVTSSMAELVSAGEVIIMSLPDHLSSEKVMLGDSGILDSSPKRSLLVIDATTSLPSVSQRIQKAAKHVGVEYLDASVSGGPDRSLKGTLTIMVGGDQGTFEKAGPLLKDMGTPYYMGPSGAGNAMKLINNMISITNTVAMVEGMALAAKVGIDPKVMYEVVSTSSGNSYQWQKKGPRVLRRDFRRSFSVNLELKDISLAVSLAEELGVPVPVATMAKQAFAFAKYMGLGEDDNTAVVKVYEEYTKAPVHSPGFGL